MKTPAESAPSDTNSVVESMLATHGQRLLEQVQKSQTDRSWQSVWVTGLFKKLERQRELRLQTLRFIDVLPSLENDQDLADHFNAYFAAQDFPLPSTGKKLLQLSKDSHWGTKTLAKSVRLAANTLSRKFMGGEDFADIKKTIGKRQQQGQSISLDLLGEKTLTEKEAISYQHAYIELLEQLGPASQLINDCKQLQLSIKISSLYPRISAINKQQSREQIFHRLLPIMKQARQTDISLTLDMEDYDSKQIILSVFEQLLFHPSLADWTGLGIAVQAYLQDIDQDMDFLLALAKRRSTPFGIRLVRGAYWDQETILARQSGWLVPVWSSKAETDLAYEQALARLFDASPQIYPAIATHNPRSLALAMAWAEYRQLDTTQFEFQMLYGMADNYQQALTNLGYQLRIYTPFGKPIPGIAYLVRRLLENSETQSLSRLDLDNANNQTSLFTKPELPKPASKAKDVGFQNQAQYRFTDPQEHTTFINALTSMDKQLGQYYSLKLDGQEIPANEKLSSYNPANPEQLIGEVALASAENVQRAIALATEAFPVWRDMSFSARAQCLIKAAKLLQQQRAEYAALEVYEAGKCWAEADANICEAIDFLFYYAHEAERLDKSKQRLLPGEHNQFHYIARGLVAVISPWNFPLAILTGMMSAALVTGNCVLVKPSSETPVIAMRFMSLLASCGFPANVLQCLPGAGHKVGQQLIKHPDIAMVAFTGSMQVGTGIMRQCAELSPGQTHIKKVIAELGGKNAIIVDSSADPDEAISGILQSAFSYQGQKCSACSRVIVVGHQYEYFIQRLCEATASMSLGDPTDPTTDLGPVISRSAFNKINQAIEEAKKIASLVHQTKIDPALNGYFIGPCIFKDVPPNSTLAQEEIFGPVLSIIPARNFQEALDIANNTKYALTGGLYSRHPKHLQQAKREFQVGNLYLNRAITGALVNRQPFGGFKLSGTGSKAGGEDYFLHFMQPKCITENTLRRGFAPDVG